jgi:hypothetical protein
MQMEAPAAAEYLPARQCVQSDSAVLPLLGEYLPRRQLLHVNDEMAPMEDE